MKHIDLNHFPHDAVLTWSSYRQLNRNPVRADEEMRYCSKDHRTTVGRSNSLISQFLIDINHYDFHRLWTTKEIVIVRSNTSNVSGVNSLQCGSTDKPPATLRRRDTHVEIEAASKWFIWPDFTGWYSSSWPREFLLLLEEHNTESNPLRRSQG
jgi:hypothetical protein